METTFLSETLKTTYILQLKHYQIYVLRSTFDKYHYFIENVENYLC